MSQAVKTNTIRVIDTDNRTTFDILGIAVTKFI
jgi:hypothetical protein